MGKEVYGARFHSDFWDTFDEATEDMTEEEFNICYKNLQGAIKMLEKDPYSNSRDCKYGILRDEGFRTMTLHSKFPKIGTGDMRLIFQVDEDKKINFYFAYGKRINKRPRPDDDIYSKSESMLKTIEEHKT